MTAGRLLTPRQQIERLAPEMRLDAALNLIDDLTGGSQEMVAWLVRNYGLSSQQARVALTLSRRSPHCVTTEALLDAIYGHGGEGSLATLRVVISHLRRKIPSSCRISTVWGMGYAMVGDLGMPEQVPEDFAITHERRGSRIEREMIGHRWTEEDDQALRDMLSNGSEAWAIAEELGRSERAVIARAVYLRDVIV